MFKNMLKNKKEIINKMFIIALSIFVLMQPFLELMFFHKPNYPKAYGLKLATFIRIIIFGIVVVLFLLTNQLEKKHIKYWMVYIGLICIYLIGNRINSKRFYSFNPTGFNYSFKGEIFYLIRMLIPIITIFMIYYSNISKKQMNNIIIGVSLLISLNVILSNIFKLGYPTYSHGKIEYTIFDWFSGKADMEPYLLSTRGFFHDPILSIALVSTLPYLIYLYIKDRKPYKAVIFILSIIALVMMGTYASTFSTIIVLSIMLLVFVAKLLMERLIIKNKKYSNKNTYITVSVLTVLMILNAILVVKSPALLKKSFDREQMQLAEKEYMREGNKEKIDEEKVFAMTREEQIKFFEERYKEVGFNPDFIHTFYSFKYDPEFWIDQMKKRSFEARRDQRSVEKDMFERVSKVSNNKGDIIFGMGFSRASNVFTLERDFLYQYYSVGIFGTILILGPYIAMLFAGIILILKQGITNFSVKTNALVLSSGLTLCLAGYSGNTVENLGISTIMALNYGLLLKNIYANKYLLKTKDKEKETERITKEEKEKVKKQKVKNK